MLFVSLVSHLDVTGAVGVSHYLQASEPMRRVTNAFSVASWKVFYMENECE